MKLNGPEPSRQASRSVHSSLRNYVYESESLLTPRKSDASYSDAPIESDIGMPEIRSNGEVIKHTVNRIFLAAGLSSAMTAAVIVLQLGTDLTAPVQVGYVLGSGLISAIGISSLLAGILTYRSAQLMKELTLARSELHRLSNTDELTGLLNRRGFYEAAAIALQPAGEANVVAMVCDIDSFKQINDRYGHAFGDNALASVGEVLRIFAADNDALVARFGGDEFVVLMTGIEGSEGAILAEGLRRGCSVLALSYVGESVQVTVSIGVSTHRRNANVPDLLHAADRALYEAKARGRNCVSQAPELKAA